MISHGGVTSGRLLKSDFDTRIPPNRIAVSVQPSDFAFPMNWLQRRFELSRGGGAGNVRPMEGLRGFAVFLVFLVHYVTFIDPWLAKQSTIHALARALHTIGNTGVDLFFVLSGYLIYGLLVSRPQPFLRFMTRRVQRIYPAFVAVFVIYVALSFVFPTQSKIPHGGLDATLYLVENLLLLPGIFPLEPMITVAWSLSYEMFYYLAIPLIITLFALGHRSGTWRALFFCTIAAATAIYCAIFGGPVRLLMFLAGILLYEVIKNGNYRTRKKRRRTSRSCRRLAVYASTGKRDIGKRSQDVHPLCIVFHPLLQLLRLP